MASCGNGLGHSMSMPQPASIFLHSKSPRDAKKTLMIVLYYFRKQRSGHVNKLNSYWIGTSYQMATEKCRKYRKCSEPTFWERRLTMKFETLRIMAQDYADRHKEPPPLPATIDTMAYAYQRICQGEDPWTALGDFSNAWYGYAKHIRPDLVREPLIKPEQETEWDPALGSFLRRICRIPLWPPSPTLPGVGTRLLLYSRYSLVVYPTCRTIQQSENTRGEHTPTFCLSQHFCSNRLYQNKYEMYEWIQEAIVKGITDVHEIERYARQKKSACTEPKLIEEPSIGSRFIAPRWTLSRRVLPSSRPTKACELGGVVSDTALMKSDIIANGIKG